MTQPQTSGPKASGAGERLVLIGGLAVFAASFVPWYLPERWIRDDRTNGWQDPDALLSQSATAIALILAVAGALAGAGVLQRIRLGSWSWGTLLTAASGASFALLALKLSLNLENTTVGIYLALTGAATMLYGAYTTRLDEPAAATAPTAQPATNPVVAPPPSTAEPATQWPETHYLLAAFLQTAADVEPAMRSYLDAFASDPARVARLRTELDLLAAPGRADEQRRLLVVGAPRWAEFDAAGILQRLSDVLDATDHTQTNDEKDPST